MLAGGMVIAAPAMVPEAAAAGQLYVSAENAQFGNLFAGGQIVEVIVRDPNRADTEVAEAEPIVRVDNNLLRMAQGVDGYWYAYIGSDAEVRTIDGVATNNLDYGTEAALGAGHQKGVVGTGLPDMTTQSTAVFIKAQDGVITNEPVLSNYNNTNNVGTNPVTSNADQSSVLGQIGINGTEWPFIQTFDFTQGEFDIVLEQAGADEIVTLDYNSADLDDYSSLTLDRNSGTQGAEVHLTITDNQLNIDPTNEDIVVFFTTVGSGSVSFTNGTQPGFVAGTYNTGLAGNHFTFVATDNSFGDNGKLEIDYNANGADNNVFVDKITIDDKVVTAAQMVFYEGSDNSGIFSNTDDNDQSSLEVNSIAARNLINSNIQ